MVCQNCQQRPANVHLTQIINGQKAEVFLCEECAGQRGHAELASPFSFNNIFTGLLGAYPGSIPRSPALPELTCDKCGLTFEKFKETGKMGCAACYEVFDEKLSHIIRHLHGNVKHVGKIPGNAAVELKTSREIENLKQLLDKAIRNEEYEKAAELRDRIRAMENSGS